jgi:hypothetical protein
MKKAAKTLTGSWRSFSAKTTPASEALLQRIAIKTAENLSAASKQSKIRIVRVRPIEAGAAK